MGTVLRVCATIATLGTVGLALAGSACIFGVGTNGGEGDGADAGLGADGCQIRTWYADNDGDGFGDPESAQEACEQPEGFVANSDDCDDGDETVNPEADETCDGVDENCNGTADADESSSALEAGDCDLQEGVCSGATISMCASDGSYAECGGDQYGDDYIEAGDEGWRCDGMDNDCDGDTDEACCSSGNTPSAVQIGDSSNDQSLPVVVPAAQGAPSDARFLVAWEGNDDLQLAHVDETGSEVGSASETVTGAVEGLDVASHSGGYAVFAVNGANQLKLLRFDGSLTFQGSKKTVNQDPTPKLAAPSAAVQGQTAWVAYSFERGSGHVVKIAGIDVTNGSITEGPDRLTDTNAGNELGSSADPEITAEPGQPTAVWWDKTDGKLRGARFQSGGNLSRFTFDLGEDNKIHSESAEPVATVGADGKLRVIFPDYAASNQSSLSMLSISPSDTGTLGGATQITGDSQTNRQPAAAAVDADGDGTDERLAVAWAQGATSDPTIVVGQTGLSNPSMISGEAVKSIGERAKRPAIAESSSKLGGTWLETSSVNARDVEYAPISIDGVGVCNPNP